MAPAVRAFANALERRRPRPSDKWHLDKVFICIRGRLHHLWWTVDEHGTVLDILVQSRCSAMTAKRLFKTLLKRLQYVLKGRRSFARRLPSWQRPAEENRAT